MTDMPTFVALVKEIDALIRERDELLQRVAGMDEPINQKKLSSREVKEIRNLNRTSHITQREIAEIYDVNPSTVSRIIRGQYWKG
jgi:DNA-binding MarR family transcriptional regulator